MPAAAAARSSPAAEEVGRGLRAAGRPGDGAEIAGRDLGRRG